jgi:hypothetical protein
VIFKLEIIAMCPPGRRTRHDTTFHTLRTCVLTVLTFFAARQRDAEYRTLWSVCASFYF